MGEWCTKFDASYKSLESCIIKRDVTEVELQAETGSLKQLRAEYMQFDAWARTLKPRLATAKSKAKAKAQAEANT